MNAAMTMEMETDQLPVRWPRLAPVASATGAVLALLLAGWLLLHAGAGQVSSLQVAGDLDKVTPDQIEQALRPLLDEELLTLNLEPLRAALERLPWVAHARVERQWPSGLRIHIWERRAFAHWGEPVASKALDIEARTFNPKPAELPEGLPRLHAPAGQEHEVMLMYQHLHQALESTPFAVLELRVDARGEWLARTGEGLELRLGREAPQAKLETLRGEVFRAVGARLNQVQYVDLRYSNGFAIGWKPQDSAAPVLLAPAVPTQDQTQVSGEKHG